MHVMYYYVYMSYIYHLDTIILKYFLVNSFFFYRFFPGITSLIKIFPILCDNDVIDSLPYGSTGSVSRTLK